MLFLLRTATLRRSTSLDRTTPYQRSGANTNAANDNDDDESDEAPESSDASSGKTLVLSTLDAGGTGAGDDDAPTIMLSANALREVKRVVTQLVNLNTYSPLVFFSRRICALQLREARAATSHSRTQAPPAARDASIGGDAFVVVVDTHATTAARARELCRPATRYFPRDERLSELDLREATAHAHKCHQAQG